MGYRWREGLGSNVFSGGKREYRDGKEHLESRMFRNVKSLILDLLMVILAVVLAPFKATIRYVFTKPKSFKGKVCFVTNSGGELGRRICIALAKEGAIIACADINEEANSKTVEILTVMGAKAIAYKMNITNTKEVNDAAKRVETDLGRVYLVVNNATFLTSNPESEEMHTKEVFGMNTLGSIWTIGAFLPAMKEANQGHIVMVCSDMSKDEFNHKSAQRAATAAIKNYSQAIRMELKLQGYRNVIITTVDSSPACSINNSMLNWRYIFTTNRSMQVNVDDVVDLAMNSIKYNKVDVSPNPIMDICNTLLGSTPKLEIKNFLSW